MSVRPALLKAHSGEFDRCQYGKTYVLLGSVTPCALTVTRGTEASKLKRHRGRATLYLNRDSEAPF